MSKVIDRFQQKFSEKIIGSHANLGDETLVVSSDALIDILQFAKQDPELQFDMLMDICGVDYLGQTPRFEVVYHLYSVPKNHRLRIKVKVPEDSCRLPSCISLWKSADWFERETWDMMGIEFESHPYLRRLLLFEGFEGHPLRKDYQIDRRQKIPEPLKNL